MPRSATAYSRSLKLCSLYVVVINSVLELELFLVLVCMRVWVCARLRVSLKRKRRSNEGKMRQKRWENVTRGASHLIETLLYTARNIHISRPIDMPKLNRNLNCVSCVCEHPFECVAWKQIPKTIQVRANKSYH